MTSNSAPQSEGRTILIVDDTPINLKVAVGYLEARGFRVVIAQEGAEGVQRAALVQPDLVLLDVMMPGIDGFETCRRLKSGAATWDIPVIFMTSLTDVEDKIAGFRAGAVDYVTKPLQVEELIARVNTHLTLSDERRTAREQLHKREREYRTLAENAPDIIARFDVEARCLYVNAVAERTFGIAGTALVGKTFDDAAREAGLAGLAAGAQTLRGTIGEICRRRSGSEIELAWKLPAAEHVVEARLVPEYDDTGEVVSVLGIFRDVSERKAAEARIRRLTNLYAALSQCNQAIVRCADEAELFPVICRDAVEFGGMKMAWIGLVEPTSRIVEPIACFGEGTEYLREVSKSVDAASPLGHGPVGVAIRECRPYWCQDFAHDPATGPWRVSAARFGWGASAALPIYRDDVAVGVFTLYSDTVDAFDEAARNLLVEMAMDISHALDRFAAQRAREALQQEIAETKSRMDNILDSIDQVIWSADANSGQLLFLNRAIETICARPLRDFFANASLWRSVVHPDDAALGTAVLKKLRETDAVSAEFRILRPNGEVRWVSNQAWLIRDAAGTPLRVDGVMSDINERKRAQAELELSAKVFEQSAESIVICDADNRILSVNGAFCEITGYSREEAIGRNPSMLKSGRHDRDFYLQMWRELAESGRWQGEIWDRRKSGDVYPAFLSISALYDASGKVSHYIGMSSDISQHKQAEERIRKLVHFDALTGLPNRALLADRITQATIHAQRGKRSMALMFLDLDRFKTINDSLGHRVGDEVLVETARRLVRTVREEDTVSRLGGDEFILLLPNTDADAAAHAAQKAIEAMALPFHIGADELTISPSIGIAMYPADGHDTEGLIQCADVAMYKAKESGRKAFRFFTPDMHAQASRTLQLENGLRRALERNELVLHFQPKVDIRSGLITGSEALLRWRHAELGTVPPTDFIRIAEDSGQILAVGEWVLRTAMEQVKAWQRAGLPALPVAVNLSAVQFRQANLIELIDRVLADNGLSPAYLELELTESMTMADPATAIAIIDRLHRQGLTITIDDFGTGYSSLSYLKRFRVDKLKIDQSFVRDIGIDREDKKIVTAIIGLAGSLGLRTIAEGVEDREQRDFLVEAGCDECQGYYFSRPLLAADFEALLRKGELTVSGNAR